MHTITVSAEDGALLTVVTVPALKVPFSQQVEQDRNNLNLRTDYRILVEKSWGVLDCPAHVFIVTSVEDGQRYKSKVVMFQKDEQLVYLTLKARADAYEQRVKDFNAILDTL